MNRESQLGGACTTKLYHKKESDSSCTDNLAGVYPCPICQVSASKAMLLFAGAGMMIQQYKKTSASGRDYLPSF